MVREEDLEIAVVYARPGEQVVVTLRVPRGTTAAEALKLSGLAARYREIDPAAAQLGIYGRRVKPDAELATGDRVEIYRGLKADPKQARRRRACKPA